MTPTASEPKLTIELDVSYQPHKRSGITTYSVALAQELAADPDVQLILVRGSDDIAGTYPDVPVRRLTPLDRVRVPADRVRLIPHQMRPVPLVGSVVVTVHDVIPLGPWFPPYKQALFRALLWQLRRQRVGVLAVSHATRDRLLGLGFDSVNVEVRQSSLPARLPPEQPPSCGGGGIAYVGNLLPHKDIATLVAAHQRLLAASDVRLHIVTSDEGARLDAVQASYGPGTAHSLCLHVRASDEERDAVLRFATVAATPSLEEGFGYAIDEALRLGTPVVASSIPAHRENAEGRDVSLFPPGDVDGLVSTLRTRLEAPTPARPDERDTSRPDASTLIRRLVNGRGRAGSGSEHSAR